MKLLSAKQIASADKFTIENEPIASTDLMERAALKIVNKLLAQQELLSGYHLKFGKGEIKVFCGIGNNGGDGLVIARHLILKGFRVKVFLVKFGSQLSVDCKNNLDALPANHFVVEDDNQLPSIDSDDLVIDSIFGLGLSRPVSGFTKELIQSINYSNAKVIALDISSGLMADGNQNNDFQAIIQADVTYTFQLPKFPFLLPSYAQFTGFWEVLDIGLLPEGINNQSSNKYFINHHLVKGVYHPRGIFSHKGTYGHSLIVGGSKGKMGAVVLACKSALKAGAGLVTAHVPKVGLTVLQTTAPEVMVNENEGHSYLEQSINLDGKQSIGFGIGAGQNPQTANALKLLIQNAAAPLVIDADGINILAENKTWLAYLPPETILTPHPAEFKRLVGTWETDEEKIALLLEFSRKFNVITILKGAFTVVATPGGNLFFNSTGNNGMATAGSGDCLLGLITSLRGQGYSALNASILGVYIHGLAGDIAAKKNGFEAVTAETIFENFGEAFKSLY